MTGQSISIVVANASQAKMRFDELVSAVKDVEGVKVLKGYRRVQIGGLVITVRSESDLPRFASEVVQDVPNSPIAGEDGLPVEIGKEIRRARFNVELVYACDSGEHVDIQAEVYDAVYGLERETIRAVDLTEHVILVDRRS